MSGPKADRLKLFRATGMNLSARSSASTPTPTARSSGRLDEPSAASLPLEATDHLGVVSRLWPVTDQHVVSAVTGLMGPKPVFIADGHHRYETGLQLPRRAAGGRRGAATTRRPPNFMPDDARRHERPGPGHPADAPARLAACRR